MTSNDVYVIVNNEQQFRLYVVEQFGKMDARMSRIETRLDGLEFRVKNLESGQEQIRAEIQTVRNDQIAFNTKVDMLLWGSGFIIAAVTLGVSIYGIAKTVINKIADKAQKGAQQFDMDELIRKIGEVYNLEPRR